MENFKPHTLVIGSSIIELEEVRSTNYFAQCLIRDSNPIEGTVVFAHHQLEGKGSHGTQWASERNKNIIASVILFPKNLDVKGQFFLNETLALGVYDYVNTIFPGETKIKWPNDIYVRDRKVAGILIENTVANSSVKSTVFGVGININQESFPEEVPHASSFKLLQDKVFDLTHVLSDLCGYLDARYLQFKAGKRELIKNDYLLNLYRLNETAPFVVKKKPVEGKITGVDEKGKMMVEIDGTVNSFGFKEIEYSI